MPHWDQEGKGQGHQASQNGQKVAPISRTAFYAAVTPWRLFGLVVTRWSRSMWLLYAGHVSTGMGDRSCIMYITNNQATQISWMINRRFLPHYYKCTKLTFDWCHDFWCFLYRITSVLLSTSNLIMIIDFSAALSNRFWDFHFIYEYTYSAWPSLCDTG